MNKPTDYPPVHKTVGICPHCAHPLHSWDRGSKKCQFCHNPIIWDYPKKKVKAKKVIE